MHRKRKRTIFWNLFKISCRYLIIASRRCRRRHFYGGSYPFPFNLFILAELSTKLKASKWINVNCFRIQIVDLNCILWMLKGGGRRKELNKIFFSSFSSVSILRLPENSRKRKKRKKCFTTCNFSKSWMSVNCDTIRNVIDTAFTAQMQ